MAKVPGSTGAIDQLERALRAPGASPLPRGILGVRPSAGEERDVRGMLNRVIVNTTVRPLFDDQAEFNFKDVGALYSDSLSAECPRYVIEVLNYLRLYQEFVARMRTLNPASDEVWFGSRTLSGAAAPLVAAIEGLDGFDPTLMTSRLVLGKLHALGDRDAARRVFADLERDLDRYIDVFGQECGAKTYFDRATLMEHGRETIVERRDSLPVRQEYGPVCGDETRFLVVMSCDRRYWRIYMPYWLSVAQYLQPQGFAFHVVITDVDDEVFDLLDDAEALSRALTRFRGLDPGTSACNVSYSSVTLPPWCPNRRSFAAVARHLYAREISERAGMQVVVLDIDVIVADDPTPWFESLPSDRVGLAGGYVKKSIDPWKKFFGGVYVLPHTESAFALARRLEDYLLCGLDKQHSWYLDQNAIAYLYETAQEEDDSAAALLSSLTSASKPWPPVRGLRIHGLFERRQAPDEARA